MTQQVGNYDQPVLALASRYPLLFNDLQAWLRSNPASARLPTTAPQPVSLRHGEHELLFNDVRPESVLQRLADVGQPPLIHLFTEPSGLLRFLTQRAAIDCIAHPGWVPLLLLPLQHASHMQQWLMQMPPRQWPWLLLDARSLGDQALAQTASSIGRQMLEFIGQLTTKLAEQLASRYADRPTPAQILRGQQRPLRTLIWALESSAYQRFCARDVADALTSTGVETRTLISPAGHAKQYEMLQAVDAFDPDVLLLNGRERSDFSGLPQQLCVLAWDQDYALCNNPDYPRCMADRDRLMLMVVDWRQDALASGVCADRIAHINLGTNHRLYQPPAADQTPQYDVLFVGNIYPFDVYQRIVHFDQLGEPAQRIVLHARTKLADWIASRGEDEPFVIPDTETLLRETMAELGMAHSGDELHWRFLVTYFRYRIAHLLVREMYVSSLKDFRLGLFGRGWEKFPAVASLAQPEIENGQPLCDAIHRSAINLHLHTWTVHHPRLYDTAAAGGFLLVGRVPEAYPLDRVFEAGAELDTFGSIAELKRKIRHYLDHPDERQAMASRAADRARREHTMECRARDMIGFLAKELHDQHR